MEVQPCFSKQVAEQTIQLVKAGKGTENKTIESVTFPTFGLVHVKAPTFDGSTHLVMYLSLIHISSKCKKLRDN